MHREPRAAPASHWPGAAQRRALPPEAPARGFLAARRKAGAPRSTIGRGCGAARAVIGAELRGGTGREARRAMEAGGEARAGSGVLVSSRFRCALRARGLQDISGDGGVLKELLRPGTGQPVPPAATVAGTVPVGPGVAVRCGAVPRGAAGSPAPCRGAARSVWPCGSTGTSSRALGGCRCRCPPLRWASCWLGRLARPGSPLCTALLASDRTNFQMLSAYSSEAFCFGAVLCLIGFCSAWGSLCHFLQLTD